MFCACCKTTTKRIYCRSMALWSDAEWIATTTKHDINSSLKLVLNPQNIFRQGTFNEKFKGKVQEQGNIQKLRNEFCLFLPPPPPLPSYVISGCSPNQWLLNQDLNINLQRQVATMTAKKREWCVARILWVECKVLN